MANKGQRSKGQRKFIEATIGRPLNRNDSVNTTYWVQKGARWVPVGVNEFHRAKDEGYPYREERFALFKVSRNARGERVDETYVRTICHLQNLLAEQDEAN